MRRPLILLASSVLLFIGGCVSRHAGDFGPPMTPEERALGVQSFDEMWSTIRDRHFDPSLNGVDWEAVKTEFRPRVEAARTHAEVSRLMHDALERLGQSHFGIISADAYSDMTGGAQKEPKQGDPGEVGIDVRAINEEAVIVSIDEHSPADVAGIRPGWKVLEVNGIKMSKVLERTDETFKGQNKREGMMSHALRHAVTGAVGESMRLKVLDGEGRRKTFALTAVKLSGEPVIFGNLPAFQLEYSARRLASGVGYIRFSIFFDPATLMPWYREQVASFSDAPGLIIDLRGNPGGIGGMAMGMGNMLVTAPNQKLGTMTMREGTINFILNQQAGGYKGPVAVLIDELSMSTSEIMSGGLQAIGRARIFGVRTPGMALPSQVIKLPNGDGFQYASANYVSADGKVLEGHGVTPDETVRVDAASLLKGHDAVIEAAEAWIRSQKNSSGG